MKCGKMFSRNVLEEDSDVISKHKFRCNEIFIVTLDTDRMRQLLYFVKCSYFRVRHFAAILCIPAY